MRHRSCFPLILGMFLLLTACAEQGTVYHHFIHPGEQPKSQSTGCPQKQSVDRYKGQPADHQKRHQWAKCDTLHFADTLYFEKGEAPSHLMLKAILRHDDFYHYEDIYLNADITVGFTEDSTATDSLQAITAIRSTHTFRLSLVNSRHRWSGKGWGSLYTAESTPCTVSLPENLYRKAAPTGNDPSDTTRLQLPFQIAMTSAMQDKALPGIESVGLQLYKK